MLVPRKLKLSQSSCYSKISPEYSGEIFLWEQLFRTENIEQILYENDKRRVLINNFRVLYI